VCSPAETAARVVANVSSVSILANSLTAKNIDPRIRDELIAILTQLARVDQQPINMAIQKVLDKAPAAVRADESIMRTLNQLVGNVK
jgi:hypothetical protein